MLKEPVLTDRPGISVVAPITQWGVSDALASVWAKQEDERAKNSYWYYRWNGEWGAYDHAEKLTSAEQERLKYLQEQLEKHPFISRFEPED